MGFILGVRKRVRIRAIHSTKRRHITAAFLLVLISLAAGPVPSMAGDLDKVLLFNIKAQTVDKALLQFGAQAHIQLSFAPELMTGGLRTQPLQGSYSVKEELAKLLKGTGLKYVSDKQTVEILPTSSSNARASKSQSPYNRTQTQLSDPSGGSSQVEDDLTDPPAKHSGKKRASLQEVIVTGSRLPTTSKEGPQEVQIYDREQIDQSGQNSPADFIGTLPSVSQSPQAIGFGIGTTVTLRGLPVGTTLVLLNGRRLESSGASYWVSGAASFDLNDIPLAAVERIEIDEDGSSAVYGSDALGGVVNIILRRDFNGIAADARYGWAKDTDVTRTDIAWGKQWDKGGLEVIGSLGMDGGLLTSDRRLSASNDYTSFGGSDEDTPACFPGDVFSQNGAPLPGAPVGSDTTYAAVTGSTATEKPPLSQFTYGKLNTCSLLARTSLIPSTHRDAGFAQGHVEITPAVELFTELMYTNLTQTTTNGYPVLSGTESSQAYSVSASNPYNPFGETVGVTLALRQFPNVANYSTEFFRPLVGIRGTISRRWQWEVSAWQSTDWTEITEPYVFYNSSAIQSYLDAADPSTALNPFTNGPVVPGADVQSIFPATATANIKFIGRDRSVEAFIRGPAVTLPTGDVQAIIGGTYVRSAFDTNYVSYGGIQPPDTREDFGRDYYALFVETSIPLIRRPHSASTDILALTLAARHDEYSDFGGATTYQSGIELRPVDGLLLRGTYATAFEAPSLPSLYTPVATSTTTVVDPTTNQPVQVGLTYGGNPYLTAMTGHSESGGVVYSGDLLPGITLSVTQWEVLESNAIQSVSAQVLLDDANDFPGRVIRNSAGVIEDINDAEVNFGNINAAGIDYQFKYRHSCGSGACSIGINATEIYHYVEALVPGQAAVNGDSVALDTFNWAPRWKGTIEVGWDIKSLTLNVEGLYTGPYQDYDSASRIGNFWTVNTNIHLALGQVWQGTNRWSEGAYLEGGATNLFNRAPQFSNFYFDFYGYDRAEANILGRSLYIQLGMRW